MSKSTGRYLLAIILGALAVRVIFTLFVAPLYFSRENIFADNDTYAFAACFENLFTLGEYTVNPGHEYGYFGRMPGYPFFMGLFYLLAGQSWELAFKMIGWSQVLIDLVAVFYFFRILKKLTNSDPIALTGAALYSFYPFIIVWTPVVYSESLSITFLLVAFFHFLERDKGKHLIISGTAISIALLLRPQIALLIPIFTCLLLSKNLFRIQWNSIKPLIFFLVPILIIYGSWPVRNYVFHGKIVLTQDLRGFPNWSEGVLSFMQYMFSKKQTWEPQFSQIVANQPVDIAEIARDKEDSLLLSQSFVMASTCGSGFSYWGGYWKTAFARPSCDTELAKNFDYLRKKEVRNHPLDYYLLLPLQNLNKAFFKSSLTDSESFVRRAASLLFLYRTLLILTGLFGIIIMLRNKALRPAGAIVSSYFFLLYFTLCFGTSVQMRNIEMRYFLPADVLLLIPVTILLFWVRDRINGKREFGI